MLDLLVILAGATTGLFAGVLAVFGAALAFYVALRLLATIIYILTRLDRRRRGYE